MNALNILLSADVYMLLMHNSAALAEKVMSPYLVYLLI
jgi:hypothetical protein